MNTDNSASKYEFSSIELYDNHIIPVDYNMGIRVDLVDKEVYSLNPANSRLNNLASTKKQAAEGKYGSKTNEGDEVTDKMLNELKERLVSVRDKFLLSEKEVLPDHIFAK